MTTSVSAKEAVPLQQAPRWAIWAALGSVYLAWGSTYLAIRFVVLGLPPFLSAGLRFLIAGGLLYAFRRLRGDGRPTRQHWRAATFVGLLMLLGGNGCVVWAEQHVPSGVAALLVATSPVWMVLMDPLFRGSRRPHPLILVGVLLGFAGTVVLVGPGQLLGLQGRVDPWGALLLTLAAIFWSVGSLYSRKAALPDSPLLGTSMEMLVGGLALFLLGTCTGEWNRLAWGPEVPRALGGMAYLIVFGSWIGFSAYTWLLRVAPTPFVSTYAYVNPLVAIVVGHFVGGEALSGRVLLAAAMVLGAVALITALQGRGQATPREEGAS
jgi:drug/metabolite transporter (DMT)-like permease